MKKLIALEEKYDALKKEIELGEDKIRDKQKEAREVGEVIYNLYKKEFSKSVHLKEIIPTIKKMLKTLKKFEYDEKLVCGHFGIDIDTGVWRISMSDRNVGGVVQTLLVFAVKRKWVNRREVGVKERTFNKLKSNLKKEFGIIKHWNGGEDHNTMSVVLDVKLPKSLRIALDNYRNHRDFGFPTNSFEKMFLENYERSK